MDDVDIHANWIVVSEISFNFIYGGKQTILLLNNNNGGETGNIKYHTGNHIMQYFCWNVQCDVDMIPE